MIESIFPRILIMSIFFAFQAVYSGDVCCILSKTKEDKVETVAMPSSSDRCSKGAKIYEDFSVCTAKPDHENTCPQYSEEKRCEACGYFWNGGCLVRDPVQVAKEQLKKEMEEKEKKKQKEKQSE